MRRFKNILVVYDDVVGADDALEQAVALARTNSARLTLIRVYRENQSSVDLIDETQKRLQRVIDGTSDADGVGITSKVLVGVPFLEIIRQVLRDGHDLVIASAEGGSVFAEMFFGSTATHLMRKCPCPVWIVKPGQPTPYSQILAAVDTRPDQIPHDPLNVKIMDLATSMAEAHGALLHVMHAWDVEGKDRETLSSEIRYSTRDFLIEKHKCKHKEAVNSLLKRYPMSQLRHEIHLPRDLPQRAIVNLVKQCGIDLILMGTINSAGVPGFFIGSAAEAVLGNVRCGVITVKPDEFVSPVTVPEIVTIGGHKVGETSNLDRQVG